MHFFFFLKQQCYYFFVRQHYNIVMLNNQKWSVQAQQSYPLSSYNRTKSKKNQSLQLGKLKLSITKKFKQDFIQSISKISKDKNKKDFNNNQQIQRYKELTFLFQKKITKGDCTLNTPYTIQQKQKIVEKNISNLKFMRKKTLQRAIIEAEQYYKKLSPQKQFLDQFGSLQRNDFQRRKRGNINLMLKKCQRQKEISKFENDLLRTKQPQNIMPIRFFTEPIHERQSVKTCIYKHQMPVVKEEYTPISSPNKISRQSQIEMNKTLQNFRFIHCINIEKANNMKKLKKQKPLTFNKPTKPQNDGTQLVMKQLKKGLLKQKLKRRVQDKIQLKNYYTTQFISPWIQEYQLSPKFVQHK